MAENFRDGKDFYKIKSVTDDALILYSPIEKEAELLRPVVSREDAEKIIDRITDLEVLNVDNRTMEHVYNDLIKTGNHNDIIRIIITTYGRCEVKKKKGQVKHEKDKQYLRLAEKLLYNEFAIALSKTYDETKAYIIERAQAELQAKV